jgi:hypothetical protein
MIKKSADFGAFENLRHLTVFQQQLMQDQFDLRGLDKLEEF